MLLYQFPHFGDIVAGSHHAVFHMSRQRLLFNPRATLDRLLYQDMSIHAPVWRDPPFRFVGLHGTQFQSTRPRGARPATTAAKSACSSFQSTRPVWGATALSTACAPLAGISIHAPAWGATIWQFSSASSCHISIHAPAWGATEHSSKVSSLVADFNPRVRVGRDVHDITVLLPRTISIHAPRVGRDILLLFGTHTVDISIHAPRVGRDCGLMSWCSWRLNFNPRAPRGARLHGMVPIGKTKDFNPRAPRGARRRASLCLLR